MVYFCFMFFACQLLLSQTDVFSYWNIWSLGIWDNKSPLYFICISWIMTYQWDSKKNALRLIDKNITLSSDLKLLVPSCIASNGNVKPEITRHWKKHYIYTCIRIRLPSTRVNTHSSRKHAYIILTPLNPTFV